MKRPVTLLLTSLALLSGLGDAARRSGGGFGGSRSSGGSYRSAPSSSYRAPSPGPARAPSYMPRSTPPNSASSSPYRAPSSGSSAAAPTAGPSRAPAPKVSLPTNAAVRSSAVNQAARSRVTPTQIGQWNKLRLPAGVPRTALTYSAQPSSGYRYQLQPGRYYPYPQSYYRQNGVGYDLLKYALIFTAVTSVASAVSHPPVAPSVVVNNFGTSAAASAQTGGDLSDVNLNAPAVLPPRRGPGLGTYLLVGVLAAALGWFMLGRRRR